MNILFVSQNNKGWMYETLYYEQLALEKEIKRNNNKIYKFGPGYKYCKNLNFKYFCKQNKINENDFDLILFYISHYTLQTGKIDQQSQKFYNCKENKILNNFNHLTSIPRVLWLNDFWQMNKYERIYYENKYKISHILSTYYYHLDKKNKNKFFLESKYSNKRIIHISRSINKKLIKNIKFNKKKIDVTLLGAIDEFYPERKKFLEILKKKKDIKFFFKEHPGYDFQKKINKNKIFGKKYFDILNNSKIFVTCGTKLNLPIIKLYEIISSGCLLMVGRINNLKKIGLKDKKNFIEVNEKNLISKINFYLKYEKKRINITKNAFELVKKNYLNDQQAKRQYKILVDIKNNFKNLRLINKYETISLFLFLKLFYFLRNIKNLFFNKYR